MRETYLDLRSDIDPQNVVQLQSVLAALREDDALPITLESADAHQAGPIFRVLDDGSWDYQPKGGEDGMDSILVTGRHGKRGTS